jgi:hypothetical protein
MFTLMIAIKGWARALGDACHSYAAKKIALYSACDVPNVEVLQTLTSALCAHLGLPEERLLFESTEWPEDNRLYDFVLSAAGTSLLPSEDSQSIIKPRLPWWEPKGTFGRAFAGPPPKTEQVGNKWYLSEEETRRHLRGLTESFRKVLQGELSAASDEALVSAKLAFPRLANAVTSTRVKKLKSKADQNRQRVIFGAIQARLRGMEYCRELDDRKIPILVSWRDGGCPDKYAAAYEEGQPWKKRIQDEKSRNAKTYNELPPAARERIIQGETKGTRPTRS